MIAIFLIMLFNLQFALAAMTYTIGAAVVGAIIIFFYRRRRRPDLGGRAGGMAARQRSSLEYPRDGTDRGRRRTIDRRINRLRRNRNNVRRGRHKNVREESHR